MKLKKIIALKGQPNEMNVYFVAGCAKTSHVGIEGNKDKQTFPENQIEEMLWKARGDLKNSFINPEQDIQAFDDE